MHSKSTLSRRFPTAAAIAATALLALPASGLAAETFGSRFANSPNNGACNGLMTAPCSYVSFIHPAVGTGDPYAGGAPSDGVIVKFRINAYGTGGPGTPATVTFRVADITRQNEDSAQASTLATGPTVTVAGNDTVEEFPARVPVKQGNHLAIDTSDANAVYASSGSDFTYVYAPTLIDGAAARTSDMVTEELLVGAVVEPDADKDGFGDETQDQCLGNSADAQAPCEVPGGGAGGSGGVDRTKPQLGALALADGGSKVSYRLSEAATLTLKVERVKKGRKVGGKCKRQTKANRSRKACKRYVKVGTVTTAGKPGANQLALPKKVGKRKLAPGRYRLTITARDSAGNLSAPKRIGYRIAR
jgi:hypothetical protein